MDCFYEMAKHVPKETIDAMMKDPDRRTVTAKKPTIQDRVQLDLKQETNVLGKAWNKIDTDKSFPKNLVKRPDVEITVDAAGTPVAINLPSEPGAKRQDVSVSSSGGLKSKVQAMPSGAPISLSPVGWHLA
jgi:hypothetical protein